MDCSYKYFEETDVPEGELIISRTDLNGNITYANDIFANISGYKAEELVGKPHSIVRHPDMPSSIFKDLWSTIRSGKMWKGYVKNLRKDGGYYWVYAEISGVYKDDELIEFKSIRSPISDDEKKIYQDRYDTLRKNEENRCRLVSNISVENVEKLKKLAKEEGISEDKILDFVLNNNLL
ncbi:PAS domain-containing protein [Sulfurospirillum sp. 1307]